MLKRKYNSFSDFDFTTLHTSNYPTKISTVYLQDLGSIPSSKIFLIPKDGKRLIYIDEDAEFQLDYKAKNTGKFRVK